MPLKGWMKLWMYMELGCLIALPSPAGTARPRFDTSTDMGLVLVPADAEIDSVIFRLRATDQDADFPLVFDITATVTPIVRIENLPCTLYNKVCQANVILTKRLVPGRLHDFAVRVKDSKGDSNSMQATISVTNATTQRDKIFPHIPAIIMVPEDTKPGRELDYVLVRSNQWSGKPVYIELWQPKELFTIRQRQTQAETRGVITLIGELDFETQSMYTLKMYATDPYTEPKKDTRNIAGLHLVVIVQDVQDVPPIFTLAPPLTKINNTVQPGDIILRVHAEDGDKGVPREVTYGLVSEGNPFTPFFNISETTGEIALARSLEELTLITHVGAPVVLSVVAEEIRRSTSERPAQASVVEVGFLLGEPGNSPPFFENDNYVAWMDENAEPGSVVNFTEHYIAKVRDEDIGKAGVFALKLLNNNGTFEISPAVAERVANFVITVRDNSLIDYETYKSLRFEIIAQEVGPATNLSVTVPCTIFIRDVNDNAPEFDSAIYEVTLSEDVPPGTRVIQVHATDKDTGYFGRIQYTRILGPGNEAFTIDPNTGVVTVALGNIILDREMTALLELSIEGRDEEGKGLRGTVPLIINLLDVNDNAPIFQKETYEFTLNEDSTNFTMPALIKALDADAEPPNNQVRYEIIHGNYENKFHLDEVTGELYLREPINKARRTRHNSNQNFASKVRNEFSKARTAFAKSTPSPELGPEADDTASDNSTSDENNKNENSTANSEVTRIRKKRQSDDVLFSLTARAYDLGVPHMSGVTRINVMKGPVAGARIVSFVVPGENPDPTKTAETLAAITGGPVSVQEIRPYTIKDVPQGSGTNVPSVDGGKKSIVVARVESNNGGSSLVDVDRIRAALAANGVGVIGGDMPGMGPKNETKPNDATTTNHNTNTVTNITTVHNEEVTVYKAENRLLLWLLIILGLLMLAALIALIICCICPGCPFYMAPRKRRVHSSETLIPRSDGRPKRHLHRKHTRLFQGSWPERKQAWSADPMRRNWQFNRRNQKAGGLASLPGDVRAIEREQEIVEKAASLRLLHGPVMYSTMEQRRRPEEERIYIEDVEGIRARGYMDSYRHQDPERGMEVAQQIYVNQETEHAQVQPQPKFIREQHFYRDGNAEVLRLVTRGPMDEAVLAHASKRPHTLVIEQSGAYRNDGKEILLQRFIEDQTHRHATVGQDFHDSFQDIERRSMESHQRQKEAIGAQAHQQQPKIVLLPERLEEDHRQHFEELGPEVQRLIIDHGSFEKAGFEPRENEEAIPGPSLVIDAPPGPEPPTEKPKERSPKPSIEHFSLHDLELARQNALLTKLLLGRDVGGGALVDSASYLETQSLPGQVAIATQTDRTTATQTEMPSRSRSDNDESEEEARIRRKLKSKKRYTDSEPRRMRTLWIKSPIEEEEMQYGSEKKTIFLRKKMRDVKDNRRVCLEPEVLREISDSLDENGEPPITARRRERQDSKSKETRIVDDSERIPDSSSMEVEPQKSRKIDSEGKERKDRPGDDSRTKSHRGMCENIVEPSFRILEKEINSLSKKLSKLTGKKMLRYSNGSETDCQDKSKPKASMTAKKIDKRTDADDTKKVTKKADASKTKRSKSTQRTVTTESPSTMERIDVYEETTDGRTRQTSKTRKSQNISTGSSDFEETMEKLKKSIPQATHADKQRQAPAKSSYVKLKRHARVEPKDLAKSPLSPLSQETGDGRDTSDTGAKGSMKAYKNERNSMRMKKYGTGTIEAQSGVASSSASSDNFKDKRALKREKLVLDKPSAAVEVRDRKTILESPSGSQISDRLRDKKIRVNEKSTTDKKSPGGDRIDSKSESDPSANSPNSDDMKQPSQKKSKSVLDRKNAVEADERKFEIEKTPRGSIPITVEVGELQREEKFVTSEKIVGAVEGKNDLVPADDASFSSPSKNIPKHREEKIIPVNTNFVDHIVAGAESQLKGRSPSIDDSKNASPGEKEDQLSSPESVPETGRKELHDERNTGGTMDQKAQFEASSDKPVTVETQDEILQKSKTPVPHEGISIEVDESIGQLPPESIPQPMPEKLVQETFPEATTIEIKEESPGVRELVQKSVSEAGVVQTAENLTDHRPEVVPETTSPEKPEEEKPEPQDMEAHEEGIEVPKQEIVEFLNHEAEDSAQALQAEYESIAKEAEKIVDILLESVVMESMEEKQPETADSEPMHEQLALESADDLNLEQKDLKELKELESKEERGVQQSADGGEFSDNFDNFCGTDGLIKDSTTTQEPNDEIPYELLSSEPSEEQVPTADAIDTKDADGDDQGKTQDERVEESDPPRITAKQETQEPQEVTPTRPVADASDSTTLETTRKAMPSSPSGESKEKLGTCALEERVDAPEVSGSLKQSETEKIGELLAKEHVHQIPVVPPLKIELLDEAVSTSAEPHEEILKPKSPGLSPRSPGELALEIPSQKEFGIADSLFVGAKIVTAPPSPRKIDDETKPATPAGEGAQDKVTHVPPIDLVELSRAMLEDADDSDSSEASRKTMLTARPYGTPRQRPVSGSEDIMPVEVAADAIPSETCNDTIKLAEFEASPEMLEERVPGDKKDLESELSEAVTKEEGTIEDKSSSIIPQGTMTSEATPKIPETDVPSLDQGPETTAQREGTKIETTEKVQLSQIQQTNLPADPDGFASLPETGIPVKSSDDATSLDETSSEGMNKFPEELESKDSEKAGDETPGPGDSSSPLKTSIARAPEPRTVTEETGRSEQLPTTRVSTQELEAKTPKEADKKAKTEGAMKRGKKDVKQAASGSEDSSKGTKKTTPPTKAIPPKKERPTKTLREENARAVKQTTVVEQPARTRDTKQRALPAEEQAPDQSNRLSKPDRMKRAWKKTEHPEKDATQKEVAKVKTLPSKDSDKSVGKKRTEAAVKQDKAKSLRVKKPQDKKVENSKIGLEKKVERLELKKIEQQPTAGDDEQELEKKAISEGVLPAEETTEMQTSSEPEKFVENDHEEGGKTPLEVSPPPVESSEFSEVAKTESQISEEKSTEAGVAAEPITEYTGEQDSIASNERVESTAEEKSAPVETIEPVASNVGEPSQQEIELQSVNLQSEDQKPPTEDASETQSSEGTEESQDIGTSSEKVLAEKTSDNEAEGSTEKKLVEAATPIDESSRTQTTEKIETKIETGIERGLTGQPSDSETGDASDKKVPIIVSIEGAPDVRETEKSSDAEGDSAVEKNPPTIGSQEKTGKSQEEIESERDAGKAEAPGTDDSRTLDLVEGNLNTEGALPQEVKDSKALGSALEKTAKTRVPADKSPSPRKSRKVRRETETTVIEGQSRYMEWYKQTREEMERKRLDRKDGEDEEVRPKWLRKRTRQRWIKVGPEDKRIFDPHLSDITPARRKKIKPLVNVESEQLKAIVRQGRRLRKARGESAEEPQIQIFAPDKPPPPLPSIPTGSRCHHHHHLIQHSEYKYEKMPLAPFYLHPQPPPDAASQLKPRSFDDPCPEGKYSSLPTESRCPNQVYDPGVAHESLPGANKLRHGELLEKKSVFDIAYSEAAPSQLRSDSTTPPS
ncbi:uncharacterized protein Cad86C [Venturia canescens]|uniref:uncharacterized protein Cad86C n=1 Tax=Venturia canescens TaxID=32260 RepID=UPI001C9D4753|nr:uncharacterized protein LOC122406435 [Venturia canescens]